MVERCISCWNCPFLGDMLVFRGCKSHGIRCLYKTHLQTPGRTATMPTSEKANWQVSPGKLYLGSYTSECMCICMYKQRYTEYVYIYMNVYACFFMHVLSTLWNCARQWQSNRAMQTSFTAQGHATTVASLCPEPPTLRFSPYWLLTEWAQKGPLSITGVLLSGPNFMTASLLFWANLRIHNIAPSPQRSRTKSSGSRQTPPRPPQHVRPHPHCLSFFCLLLSHHHLVSSRISSIVS